MPSGLLRSMESTATYADRWYWIYKSPRLPQREGLSSNKTNNNSSIKNNNFQDTQHNIQMFDKLRSKVNNHQRQSVATTKSNMDSTLDIPTINEPRKSTSSTPASTYYRSRWASWSSIPDKELLSGTTTPSSPRSLSRGLSQSTSRPNTPAATSSRGRRRLRDIFWRDSLWDESSAPPRGSRIRASSQSVSLMPPEMAEERMRGMPYSSWKEEKGSSDWRRRFVGQP